MMSFENTQISLYLDTLQIYKLIKELIAHGIIFRINQ